jgi:hypothetical protein
LPQIEKIEQLLEVATRLASSKAHYYYLWAIVKYDYYVKQGFRVTPPSVENLLIRGKQQSKVEQSEITGLFKHLPMLNDPVIQIIKQY